jgi:hypothetical protein
MKLQDPIDAIHIHGRARRSGWAALLAWRRIPLANTLWPAALLFFLPWMSSCTLVTPVTQSGFQSCYGGGNLNAWARHVVEGNAIVRNAPAQHRTVEPPISCLSIAFAGTLLCGLAFGTACMVCLLMGYRSCATAAQLLALICGSACFFLLLAQTIHGFPIDRALQQNNENIRAERAAGINDPSGQIRRSMDTAMRMNTYYTVWFWCTCLLTFLSIPILAVEGLAKRRALCAGAVSSLKTTAESP